MRKRLMRDLAKRNLALRLENIELRRENKKLAEYGEILTDALEYQNELNADQARVINTLRRVLRFFGFEVNIEDELHEDAQDGGQGAGGGQSGYGAHHRRGLPHDESRTRPEN